MTSAVRDAIRRIGELKRWLVGTNASLSGNSATATTAASLVSESDQRTCATIAYPLLSAYVVTI